MSTNGPVGETAAGVAQYAPGGAPGQLRQITRAVVTIYKEHFGRGPAHAHSHYAGGDVLVCLLEGTLTPVERSIANLGEHQRLQDFRQLFQSATEQTFRAVVEEITGRRVVSFMSGNDVRTDVASEIFVFEHIPFTTGVARTEATP
jgi:uncharacterized protein YbcI